MGTAERKLRRKKKIKEEKEMKKTINLLLDLPTECASCEKFFDKFDRETLNTWSVVVRKKEGISRVYCPQCWDTANNIVGDVMGSDDD